MSDYNLPPWCRPNDVCPPEHWYDSWDAMELYDQCLSDKQRGRIDGEFADVEIIAVIDDRTMTDAQVGRRLRNMLALHRRTETERLCDRGMVEEPHE